MFRCDIMSVPWPYTVSVYFTKTNYIAFSMKSSSQPDDFFFSLEHMYVKGNVQIYVLVPHYL